jgi:cytochrome c oxidase accessory protein FixG
MTTDSHRAPIAPNRVLPTLNPDGTRRRIQPKLARGRYFTRRRITAIALMTLFVLLPFGRWAGKPLVLLDLPAREFTFFGATFFATDGVLLMLLLLVIFVGVVGVTALFGRGFCGWACPQTVYLEFVFRPVERLFEGRPTKGRAKALRKVGKWAAFVGISLVLAHVFLAYFVPVEVLARWVTESPTAHPASFVLVFVTAGLVLLDFGYFREQMCSVACPYARIQSALLDESSLLIGYDAKRGEPRKKGRGREGFGDCIDCAKCVSVCPTGIDIRDGLQLECIACAQCADACDSVMAGLGKPLGLIGYGSQRSLAGRGKTRFLRPRIFIYAGLLTVLLVALVLVGRARSESHVTLLRGQGIPFVADAHGVRNQVRVKIENRGSEPAPFRLELVGAADVQLVAPENPLSVPGHGSATTSVFVLAPLASFRGGARTVEFRVTSPEGFTRTLSYRLLGPAASATATSAQGAKP